MTNLFKQHRLACDPIGDTVSLAALLIHDPQKAAKNTEGFDKRGMV
jgi:hypothetical protein